MSKIDTQKNTVLRKCFLSIVDRKQVVLDINTVNIMISNELLFDLKKIESDLAAILPYLLVYHIKNWPGWQRSKEYYSGKLNFKEWYAKFKQYIVVKLTYAMRNGYKSASEQIRQEKPGCTTRGSQTDYLGAKSISPFSVVINCSPKSLNTLVFTDSHDDIIIKKHPPLAWPHLTLRDLLNWPYISATFMSAEFAFKRRNCGDYQRCLTFSNVQFSASANDYIEEIAIINKDNVRCVYTDKLLGAYVKQYINTLEDSGRVSSDELNTITVLFDEFLQDIEEIGMEHTIASNTLIRFNIGKNYYSRNKKISKGNVLTGNKTEVSYCETYVPKMETSLFFFTAVQDPSASDVSFTLLNHLSPKLDEICNKLTPKLMFSCDFCNVESNSYHDIINHLADKHSMEPNFVCWKCFKSLKMLELAQLRWKHEC